MPRVECWSGLTELGYERQEIADIMGTAPPAEEEYHSPFSFQEFQEGFWNMAKKMSVPRLSRFLQTVDLMGKGDWEDQVVEETKKGAQEEAEQKQYEKYSTTKKIPRLLSKLQHTLDASELRRIVLLDDTVRADDEFASRKVWVCKECAVKYNGSTRGVFEFKALVETEQRDRKIHAKMKTLRDLQLNSSPFLAHSYPLGEIPALCTPRMYEALHDHTSRRPPYLTPQASSVYRKDITSSIAHSKAPPPPLRKPPAPPLPLLRLATAAANVRIDTKDEETSKLLDRLGLTPRVMVRGPLDYALPYHQRSGEGDANTKTNVGSAKADVMRMSSPRSGSLSARTPPVKKWG